MTIHSTELLLLSSNRGCYIALIEGLQVKYTVQLKSKTADYFLSQMMNGLCREFRIIELYTTGFIKKASAFPRYEL